MMEVRCLSGGYRQKVVHEVSFSLGASETLYVLGPNGCGKTTLFKLILNLLPHTGGEVLLNGQSTHALGARELAREIAYIPQMHLPDFPYTVREMVMMGRTSHIGAFALPKKVDEEAVTSALRQLGIVSYATKDYTKLSGGERQLVLVARAICQDARVILMDEPAANLDFTNRQIMYYAVDALMKDGRSVMITSHEPQYLLSSTASVMLMQQGQIVALGSPRDVLTAERLESVYGVPVDVVTIEDRMGQEHRICLSLLQKNYFN